MPPKRRRSARIAVTNPSTKRHRSATRRANPGSTDEIRAIWLDLLPTEVCTRIAANVAEGERSTDALHLAQASPQQCKAIVTALSHSYSLHFHKSIKEHTLVWMSIFMRDVRKLYITPRFAKLSSKERSNALLLLSAPTLCSARVPDDPRVLRAVAKATGLQELSVSLHEDGPWVMDATRLLLRSLSVLHALRKLELQCCSSWESECPFKRLRQLGSSRYALARCCPNLSKFQTVCFAHSSDPYWAIWNTLPSIREVTLTGDPPDYVIPRLRSIDSVRIEDFFRTRCGRSVREAHGPSAPGANLARRLGASVTQLLISNSGTATATEIAGLSECKRMSEMELEIEEGSEGGLLYTVCAMPDISYLGVLWALPKVRCREIDFLHPSDGHCMRTALLTRYNEATAGMMLRVVQQVPALTHLNLLQVRMRVTEIVAILKHLGSRLRHFGVSFSDQHESSFDRFTTIVETIIEHNHDLRTVSAGKERMSACLHIELKECDLTSEQSLQLKNRKIKLGLLIRRLRQWVTLLEWESFESWIEAVQWIDGHEREIE